MSIDRPLIYIAQDCERATGIENLLGHYAIVTPWISDLSRKLETQGTRCFILERDCSEFAKQADDFKGGTYGMIKLAGVKNFVQKFAGDTQPSILVLKNSDLIENECAKNGWKLLAPGAQAAKLFEDKITQWQLLYKTVEFPETVITDAAHAEKKAGAIGFPLVLQFNAGHSGGGTYVLTNPGNSASLAKKFPQRPVRMGKYIHGATYTLNALVSREGIVYTGSVSKQLTGLPEATANPASTVGNDFGAAAKELSSEQGHAIADMAKKIGLKMHEMDYAGLFGIDVVVEEKTGKAYCIEVNTHQPASIPFEAKLHQMAGKTPLLFLWIRDMIGDIRVNPRESAPADELPPLFLRGNVSQIIYRNKTGEVISSGTVGVPEGGLRSRMKLIKSNEELFRIQTYDSIK